MNLVMRLLKASRNHSLVGRTLLKKRSLIVSDGGSLGLGPETAGEGYKLWIFAGAYVPFILREG